MAADVSIPTTMLRTLLSLLSPAGVSLLVAACCWAVVAVVTRTRPAIHRAAVIATLACGVAAAVIGLVVATRGGRDADAGKRTRLLPVPGVAARTDRGTVVPLGWPAEGADEEDMPDGFEWRAIAASAGRAEANCHGWVFAEGGYWIPTESVDTILRDNGYAWIADPRPGDLIIYRDERGRPIHSGIVKAVGADGFVLVESKWGLLDVFWHTPDDQAFGEDYEYWRSSRPGHSLNLSGEPSEPRPTPSRHAR